MKKFFKKITAVITAAVVLSASVVFDAPVSLTANAETLSTTPAEPETQGATSGTSGGCTWTYDGAGKLTISGTGALPLFHSMFHAPWDSFKESITNVVIEDGVTEIGNMSFSGCTNMKSITIPESVTKIGDQAFFECKKLEGVTIPSGVTRIGSATFYHCYSLANVSILGDVTSIGYSAFQNCTALTSDNITIPSTVTSIDSSVFSGCTGLTSITIPASVISIGYSAFASCTKLKTVVFEGTTPPELKPFSNNTDATVFKNCGFLGDDDNATGIRVPEGCASAYETKWQTTFPEFKNNIAEHIHTPCGAIGSTACSHKGVSHTDEDKVEYVPFPDPDANGAITLAANKNYYLAGDIKLNETEGVVLIDGSSGGTVNICLNGHTLAGKSYNTYNAIRIIGSEGNPVEVNICNCSEKEGKITAIQNSTGQPIRVENAILNIYGGTVENKANTAYTYGILITEDGTLNMYGGKISTIGKAIVDNGTTGTNINIYGGEVSSAKNCAIEALSPSTIKISGGTISTTDTSATSMTIFNKSGSLTISGGNITNNGTGYAIVNEGNNPRFEMTGGTITGTYGVAISSGTATISEETATSTITGTGGITILIGQSATVTATLEIKGGTITSKGSHTLKNCNGSELTISGGTIKNTKTADGGEAITNAGKITAINGNAVVTSESNNGMAIYNTGTIESISGNAKVTSDKGRAIVNGSNTSIETNSGISVTIDGGEITSYDHVIENYMGAAVTISGGNLTNTTSNSGIQNLGKVTIEAGSITSELNPVFNQNGGELTISGGTYKSNGGSIANNPTGKLNLSGNPTFDNTGIRLNGTTVINITGALNFNGTTCPIYIDTTGGKSRSFTSGWKTNMSNAEPSAYFKSNRTIPFSTAAVDDTGNELFLRPSKVTFDLNYEGCTNGDPVSVSSFGKVTLPSPDPTHTGYVFKGWYDAKTDGTKFTAESTFTNGDTTLYARWEECTAHNITSYTPTADKTQHTGVCTVCGKEVTEDHTYADNWSNDTKGTKWDSDASGHWQICTLCNEKGTVADHNEVTDSAVAATCTEKGKKAGSHCSTCNFITKEQVEIPATGHNYSSTVTTEPTVDSEGVRTYTCGTCNDTYTDSIPMLPKSDHEHNYTSEVTKAATCTVNGVKTYSCECGDSYIETIPATGHKYNSEVTTEPTVDSEGVRTYTCNSCGDTYTESIAKLENNPTTDTPSAPSWPGSSSSSGGSSGSGSSNNPVVNGKEQSWTDISNEVKEIPDGGKLTVNLNGNATVPSDVIKVIANKDAVVTFKLNSEISYVVDGAKLSGKVSFADLSVGESKTELSTTNFSAIGGTAEKQFTLGRFSIASKMSFSLDEDNAGKFASLMKLNAKTGKYDFVSVAKIDANGKALVDVNGKGDYLMIVDTETKKPGDLNNDTFINSKDALELLKSIVYELSMNDFKSDYNGDGKTNSKDALDILKVVVGLIPDKYNLFA